MARKILKMPMTPREALDKAHECAEEERFRIVGDDQLMLYKPWVERILDETGIGKTRIFMISDRSTLHDYIDMVFGPVPGYEYWKRIGTRNDEEVAQECRRLTEVLGVLVQRHDSILDIAKRMKAKDEGRLE